MVIEEYSGVTSIGQNNTASTTATTSSVSITLAQANNWIVGGFALGGNRTLTANTGTIRHAGVTTGSTSGALAITDTVDNTAASAIACAITINNGGSFNYSACALELVHS